MTLILLSLAFFWIGSGVSTLYNMSYFVHEYIHIHPFFQVLVWPYVLWKIQKEIQLTDLPLFHVIIAQIAPNNFGPWAESSISDPTEIARP